MNRGGMTVEYVFAGVAVTDLEAAIAWYERLLGRPPDVRPNEREAMWRLAEMASVYLIADADGAGHAALTLFVDDLDRELAAISQGGIPTGEVQTAPGLFRKTTLSDPDGNVIQLGQTA
jgi:catechol 2,3-dioxygenase-like lactoylglutathione lyase family enzyme